MNHRILTSLCLLGLASCAPLIFAADNKQAPVAPPAHPNVVLIVLDDMNGYGALNEYAPIKMPSLEKLKTQGINFINAACNVTVCNPSRASFLSGLHASTNGAYLNGADIWDKPGSVCEKLDSLPEFFKRNGYTTWGGGKLFHSPLSKERLSAMFDVEGKAKNGFGPQPDPKVPMLAPKVQPWQGPDSDFPDVENADQAAEFIGRKHDKPFFVIYGLWRPHSPYTAPKRFFEQYDPASFTLPEGYRADDLNDIPAEGRRLVDGLQKFKTDGTIDESIWKKTLWGYCANSSFADWNIGRVIEAVDRNPCAANTIVIVCSDNGYHCGEKMRWEKGTLWEQSSYVPLLVRTPQTRGAISKRTVSLVDIYPTLIELCGLKPPAHTLDGHSFATLLSNPAAAWDHPSFTAYGKANGSVRDERYRYIRYSDGTEELYDHSNDPREFSNLLAPGRNVDPAQSEVVKRLRLSLPKTWAPSWGGRWEVERPGESGRLKPEYALPPGGLKPESHP